ncbi:MAG: MoaD/ThiS family protein [Chloroflexi bacterium]|nr:MoaD/ThiS family protein [Chloroflexota bacterium]
MGKVKLKIAPSLDFPANANGAWRLVERDIAEGATISQLLTDLLPESPSAAAIFDPGSNSIHEHIAVALNGILLESGSVTDTKLSDGDSLVFLSAFSGG